MRRRRLRVQISPELLAAPAASGHGNMWRHVLARLGRNPGVELRRTPDRRRADLLLVDGHQPAPTSDLPIVAHLHEAGWGDPALRATLDPTFLSIIEAQSAATGGRADAVITPSWSSRTQLVEVAGVPAERIAVVPHGVDTEVFNPAAAGTRPARPYVLFVGTVLPRKNLRVLRDAVDELLARGFEHDLVVVAGPAPDRTDNEVLLAEALGPLPRSGRPVISVGSLDDAGLAAVMAGADCLCLPSLMEGFGLPVLEAMACGTAVVVSDRGALPEVVGDAGVVVEPSVEAVAEGLATVLGDPDRRERLAAAGHQRASAMTWDRAADGWLAVLEGIAGR